MHNKITYNVKHIHATNEPNQMWSKLIYEECAKKKEKKEKKKERKK